MRAPGRYQVTTALALILIVGGAVPIFAQFKNSTPIPPSVPAPDKVETPFGTVHLDDGFPDKESADKIYSMLDFQRAVQGYLLGLPAVSQYANRQGMAGLGPANSTVNIYAKLMNAKSLNLTANNNTPYTWIWLDLRKGPLVIEVPPKVLGLIDDMWYHWVADVGVTGADKGAGGKYLIVPPDYKGDVPQTGYFVVRPKTFWVWVPWRSFLVNGDPTPGVDLIKKMTKIYPLSQAGNPPTPTFNDVTGKNLSTLGPGDYSFWEALNQVVQEEPTDPIDATTLGLWASIGIQKGKPFAPDARMKKILTQAAQVGDAAARTIMYRWRGEDGYFYPDSAWRRGFVGGYQFEENGARNLNAYAGFFFYATGITPAMDSKMVGVGSQYMMAFVDSKGNMLDGSKNYRLHLPKDIPVKDFWSVIVYDNQTRSMLQTDQDWPAVSSQTKGLQTNADGSVDVYFGPKAPAGKESNWVQTAPNKGWNAILRLYGPLEPWFNKTWRPGEVELTQ
jgi:hypothetical protein